MKKVKNLINPAAGSVTTEQNWRRSYEELVEAFNDAKLMRPHLGSDWGSILIEVEQDKNGVWTPIFPR